MKQVAQNFRSGELSVLDVPAPALRPGGVLVAVGASLVSVGTEKMVVNLAQASLLGKARQRPDQVRQVIQKVQQEGLLTTYQRVMNRLDTLSPLGYSCAGTVMAVGEGVTDFQVGQRVACAGGGYANHAETVFIPHNLVAPIPDSGEEALAFEEAAFATLGAVALQGVRQADPTLGESMAVVGLGLLGLLTVQMLAANGCQVIGMDPNPQRCHLAESLGCKATATSNAAFNQLATQYTHGRGIDGVLITAGTPSNAPIELAAEISRDRGRVVAVGLVGLDIPRKPFYEKELDLRLSRSYGPGRYDSSYEEGGHDYPLGYVRWTEQRNMIAFLDLLAAHKLQLQPLITHRFPIDQAEQAYELITGEGAAQALGVLLTYPRAAQPAIAAARTWLKDEPGKDAESKQAPSASVLQLGLVGAGTFAQGVLLPALKTIPQAQLRAVCNTSGLAARHVAGKYQAAYCTSDPNDLFTDPDLDAVLITTRHDSHAGLVIRALGSGRPVFVEKPLAVDLAQLQEIISAYQQATNPFLMVGFNRRFAPLAVQLKDFLAGIQEPLAVHYQVNAGYIPPEHWVHDPVTGGGRLIGEACHFIDFMAFLTGARPTSLHAQALPNDGRYRNDNVAVTIRFHNGALGTLNYLANGDKAYPKERVQVFGGGAVAYLDDFRSLELFKGGRKKTLKSRFRQEKGHRQELQAFVQAVRTQGEAPIPFASLVSTTLASFLIETCLRSGQPVAIEMDTVQPDSSG
jgi:predicted dehydrogenase/threonine dehydrogenase-like Zn-dependent dehydrogenase